jgi:NAD(P)-dependent dehydrogenase (short-subunit alcohol dehydrogenase family)
MTKRENTKQMLITGGTSGLGRSLVKQFLDNGYTVFTLGRNGIAKKIQSANYTFLECDLADLNEVRKVVEDLVQKKTFFDILINNAGILSPPKFQKTMDGYEFSYQVNFLSHVLLTRLLLDRGILNPNTVINISSPIYTKGTLDINKIFERRYHGVLQTYSNTKLFMALFTQKMTEDGIPGFSFNPGTFSSGIYRFQKKWFHYMYKIAAPFMISSDRVASGLFQIVHSDKWADGKMMDRKGKVINLKNYDPDQKKAFWNRVEMQIKDFLRRDNIS